MPIDVGTKIFNFVVYHKSSDFLSSYSWSPVALFHLLPNPPFPSSPPKYLFYPFYPSVSFFFSSLLAATFVCAALTATEHRCLYFGQRCSLSASSELIALSNDSHPVRPIVLVEYALKASAICSADWHPLCHLLIFWVFLKLKPLGFFFFFLPPKWPFLYHCQTAARGSDWQMFSIWIPCMLEGNVAVALPNFFSESINVFIYFFISERQSASFVLMSVQQAVGGGCRF